MVHVFVGFETAESAKRVNVLLVFETRNDKATFVEVGEVVASEFLVTTSLIARSTLKEFPAVRTNGTPPYTPLIETVLLMIVPAGVPMARAVPAEKTHQARSANAARQIAE